MEIEPVCPAAAAAAGRATPIATLAPVRGLASVGAGASQIEGVLGALMGRVAKTPGVRLIVIRKEVRALAVDPEVRVVAITRDRRVVVPAVEQRTFAIPAETRSIAA